MELQIISKFQSFFGVQYKSDGSDPVKYKPIYYWFLIWTLFGAEYGYLVVLPTWQWNIDPHTMRRAMVITVASMYVGQWIKSYTPWPRPHSPPVARLEHIYVAESTMPSTHACLGTALPFSLLFFSLQLYDFPVAIGIFCASFCAINICLSRIYLGMHYPSDIIAGSAISICMLITLHPYVFLLDAVFLEHLYLAALAAILLAVIFPAPCTNECGLRADTCRLLGVLLALYIGQKFFKDRGFLQTPCASSGLRLALPEDSFTFERLGKGLLRFAIGFPIALLVRAITRVVMNSALITIINSFPPQYKPPKGISLKRWGPYEIPFYLISYTLIALSIIILSSYGYLLTGLTHRDFMQAYPSVMQVPQIDPWKFYCTNRVV